VVRLSVVSGDELVRILGQAGFIWDYTQGSHMILLNGDGLRESVPRHRELGRGLLRALIRDAGLTREEFWELYRQ
jgi:predicted RNA binding protein YcfA (HicA-like mRNA interferase family)